MSRQIKQAMKLAQIQKGENSNANDEEDFKKMNTKNLIDTGSKPKKPVFAGFGDDSDEDEEEEQVIEPVQNEKKDEKKKKNKKKRKNKNKEEEEIKQMETPIEEVKNEDDQFLNEIIEKAKIEEEQRKEQVRKNGYTYMIDKGCVVQCDPSILFMERSKFSYKRELRQLFQESAQKFGAMGLEDGDREERKQGNNIDDQIELEMEGATKRQKKRMKIMHQRQVEQNKTISNKKYLFVQPDKTWPRPPAQFLTMETIKTYENGQRLMTFKKSQEYEALQKKFKKVQESMSIQSIYDFLHKNFYHHESLLYFADFLRLQGKFSDAFQFLQRCLFAFEYSFSHDFQPCVPSNLQEFFEKSESQFFVPQVQLDYSPGCENLNIIFAECLVKYIDVLGRKGCSKTALEVCKLLLGLNPKQDTWGVLLRIDFYSLRAKDYEFLIKCIENFQTQIYHQEDQNKFKISCIKLMPNLLLSQSLAYKRMYDKHEGNEEEFKNPNECFQNCYQQISDHVQQGKIYELFNQRIDDKKAYLLNQSVSKVILCLILYPQAVKQMLEKIAKKQLTQTFKKSWYKGYQSKNWKQIMQHDIFQEAYQTYMLNFDWIVSENEKNHFKQNQEKQIQLLEETVQKVFTIFVERSGSLFADDDILMWLREIIGFCLNKIDEDDFSEIRELFNAQMQSGIVNCHFTWTRYRSLKTSDFKDDLTIIAAQDLMAGNQPQNQFDEFQIQENNQQHNQQNQQAEQQINQMINQLARPVNPVIRQQQQMDPQYLIQEAGLDLENMDQENFEEMQRAIIASMGDVEEIIISDEEYDDEQ